MKLVTKKNGDLELIAIVAKAEILVMLDSLILRAQKEKDMIAVDMAKALADAIIANKGSNLKKEHSLRITRAMATLQEIENEILNPPTHM